MTTGGGDMKRLMLKIGLGVVLAVLGTASTAWCDSFSLSLVSSGGGIFDYGITVPANTGVTFDINQTITLTGLSGVTSASVSGFLGFASGFAVSSFTSTSVTLVDTAFPFGVTNPNPVAVTLGDFLVDSTAPLGTVNWSGQTSVGTFSGTVGGPVATPEPETLSLLLAGMAALGSLCWSSRRKRLPTGSHRYLS